MVDVCFARWWRRTVSFSAVLPVDTRAASTCVISWRRSLSRILPNWSASAVFLSGHENFFGFNLKVGCRFVICSIWDFSYLYLILPMSENLWLNSAKLLAKGTCNLCIPWHLCTDLILHCFWHDKVAVFYISSSLVCVAALQHAVASAGFSYKTIHRCTVLARKHCRISPPCLLAECHKKRLNQGSFVLLYLAFAFSRLCLVYFFYYVFVSLLSCILQCELTWMALYHLIVR